MFKNHFKIALRSLGKKKLFAGLNIFGLAMGLSIASLLLLYVQDELSFNKMHQKIDQIYRVIVDVDFDGDKQKWANAPNAVGPTAAENIAGIQSYARFLKHNFGDKAFVNANNKKLVETHLYWADSSLFNIFDINILQSASDQLLYEPNQIILSESTAAKYFGAQNPIGKAMTIDNDMPVTVVGVYEDLPSNMTLDANMIGSFSSVKWAKRLTWNNSSFETYLLLQPETDPVDVEASLAALLDENIEKENQWFSLYLQPLDKIHLYSADISSSYSSRLGNPQQVRLLIFLVIVVLLIACINYMNMATAQSQQKAKEVGINKTIGANRGQLISRFYIETMVLVAFAYLLSLILMAFFLPLFNVLADKSFQFLDLFSPLFLFGSLGIALFIILLSGSYPALYLSSFSPKSLFSNVAFSSSKGGTGFFRKGLVVTQFVASVIIIIATLVFFKQLQFIQNKQLGYQPELVVGILTSGAENSTQVEGLLNNLRRLPEVTITGRAQTFPGEDGSGRNINKPDNEEQTILVQSNRAGNEIVDLLGLKLLSGKTLPNRVIAREDSVIQVLLNKTAVDFLGYTPEEAIGREAPGFMYQKRSEIIGVVEDFHFQSFHQPIGGYVFHNNPSEWLKYALVKLNTNELATTIQKIKSTFEQSVPNSAFEYTFLDQHLEQLYRAEQREAKIFLIFAILTIFIACLGLFGLTAYTAERRTKEIGIRKILGASITNLVGLLSKDILVLVLIAFFIATPIAWYLLQGWLEDFAYSISIPWWIFALAGIVAVSIALLTVSFQSIKAALANPVKSLRSE